MVVENLDSVSVTFAPCKAKPELIVDANAVLALTVTRQDFQMVSWRRPEIFQTFCRIKLRNLLQRRGTKISRDSAALAGIPQ